MSRDVMVVSLQGSGSKTDHFSVCRCECIFLLGYYFGTRVNSDCVFVRTSELAFFVTLFGVASELYRIKRCVRVSRQSGDVENGSWSLS